MTIRRATLGDLGVLTAIGGRMHEESGAYGGLPFDAGTTVDTIRPFIDGSRPDRACFVDTKPMLHNPSHIVGGVLCFVAPFYFSKATYVGELAVYIEPEFRGGFAAARLINAMAKWGRGLGAVQCRVGVTAGISDALAAKLYQRLGFQPAGSFFAQAL